MNAPGSYRIRRATTDDLPQLMTAWAEAALPAAELEKQFTEFQVAENPEGRILGAVALQVAGTDGLIHSETFADFALCDTLRPLLWQRLETVAHNHGLFRLWTTETAPFWKMDAGFANPSTPAPEAFAAARGPWLALRLKDEAADPTLLEAQFRAFREAEKAKREKLLRGAAALKTVGTVIAAVLFILGMAMLFWFFRSRSHP